MPFKDILGHDRSIGVLKKALSSGRLAHSFIFLGPEGVGKRATAIATAKALNCQEVKDDFCGVCQTCRQIGSGSYPDVILIGPQEGIIRIDEIRELQKRLQYKASGGGKKVAIVDGAERVNREAANAFLKTLEEPPSDSVIVLISIQGFEILPTILSRCQRINFSPLGRDIIAQIIVERLRVSRERAGLLATFSGGSVGKALRIDAMLDGRKGLIERLEGLNLDRIDDLFKLGEEVSKGEEMQDTLEVLKIWYRDLAVFSEGREDMVINTDLIDRIRRRVGGSTFERLWEGFMAICQAERDIMPPRYANKQLAMETLLMELVGDYLSSQ
ncbi:MAG: DNA polymerase III subunit delta' [Deltaproteobacteria bacterium]|nr:DNA polymerase III subunit delta' [Deltaproteobacteria bacterium]